MKVFPAEYCVRRAIDAGCVKPGTLVAETSSGTMAHGLAIVCALRGLALTIVTDPVCDARMVRKLRGLGARVEVVSEPAAAGGYQAARLERLHAICAENADSWWLNQYDNPANAGSYAAVAAELVDRLGRVDVLVATVGSGGSICGVSAGLRQLFADLEVVAVDTFQSVLFGQPDGSRMLRGLGNSILPLNLDHSAVDEVHWVSAAEAFTATRTLHRRTSLFRGPTSGAAWMVARWYAETRPEAHVVCLFPDTGDRYLDTVYDDEYMAGQGLLLPALPGSPVGVGRPSQARDEWSSMRWQRRTLEVVTAVA
jgi:S-sulfo-L-cysteine synthase (3-phospho-L-serine-dependent)